VASVSEVKAIYQKYRSPLLRYRAGAPAGFLAAIMAHESGGRIDSRGDPTLGEVGLFQIENSFVDKIGVPRDLRLDVDGSIWLGGLEYAIRAVEMYLAYPRLIALGSEDSWKLARSSFAIGSGGTKSLIEAATGGHRRHAGDVFGAIRRHVNSGGAVKLGSQSAEKVQKRVNAIDEQWRVGIQVAGAYYGAPELPPAPRGVSYTLPKAVKPYLASPAKQLLIVAGLAGAATIAIRATR
jgi:hypothetical protein